MQKIEVLADPSLGSTVPGNLLTIELDTVKGPTLGSEPELSMAIVINDGQPSVNGSDEIVPTEIYLQMSIDKAQEFSAIIQDMVHNYILEEAEFLRQALAFKSAQLSCVKGEVGSLQITKVSDSDRGDTKGFAYYDLAYFDDVENTQIHYVSNIECYVPFLEEEQYEWLRTLVGGNHQYTSTIKVSLEGFTLDEVRNSFNDSLRNKVEPFQPREPA